MTHVIRTLAVLLVPNELAALPWPQDAEDRHQGSGNS